jgi:UDP-N-acetylglucosamine 2-epimerase
MFMLNYMQFSKLNLFILTAPSVCARPARPNISKITPLLGEFAKYAVVFTTSLVHTAQQCDFEMPGVFFEGWQIPDPDIHLNVDSHSHGVQIDGIMIAFAYAIS